MSQFMKDHPGLALGPVKKGLRVPNLNGALFVRVVAIGFQPMPRDVVTHALCFGHLIFDPDSLFAQPIERGLGNFSRDAVKMVIEELQRIGTQLGMLVELGIHENRPSLKVQAVVLLGGGIDRFSGLEWTAQYKAQK